MIECTDKNIWYIKKRKKKVKRYFTLFLVVLFILSIIIYYKCVVAKQIFNVCSDNAEVYSIQSTNEAVLLSLANNIKYADLIYIEKNSSGDIVLISANSHKINLLGREVVSNAQIFLNNKLKSGVRIPLFAFSGVKVLSGYGKKVNYKVLSVSSVSCSFKSEFKSMGINQTLHSIYVEVLSEVKIEVPLSVKNSKFSSEILVCETVLIGKVPEIYLQGGLLKLTN